MPRGRLVDLQPDVPALSAGGLPAMAHQDPVAHPNLRLLRSVRQTAAADVPSAHTTSPKQVSLMKQSRRSTMLKTLRWNVTSVRDSAWCRWDSISDQFVDARASASNSDIVKRTLTMNGSSPSTQWP